jgi:hypothetical protein
VCNPGTGTCETVAKGDGTPCDADKNPCTANDQCKAGKCVVGVVVTCPNETGPCSTGECQANTASPTGYQCVKKPKTAGTICDDGKFCTEPGKCDAAGNCAVGPAKTCPAPVGGNPCVKGTCDETLKQCNFGPAPAGAPCSDNNVCTTNDACNADAFCQPGKPAPTGTACDDGQPCTAGEVCNGGGGCDPGKPIPPGGACNDGKFCTEGETCNDQGQCVNGKQKLCPNGPNKCIVGVCNDAYDKCDFAPLQTCCMANADCNDGKPCTADACQLTNNYCAYKPIDGCCNPVIYENTFDDGKLKEITIANGSGQHFLGWQVLSPSPQYVSPSGALYYGDAAKKNFNFVNPEGGKNSGNFALPTVLLPKTPGLYLEFDLWIDTEVGEPYDEVYVQAHPIGSMPPTTIWSKNPAKASPDTTIAASLPLKAWTHHKVPLDKWAGTLLTISFTFDTVDAVQNEGQGVYLDNIRIGGPPCGGPPPG